MKSHVVAFLLLVGSAVGLSAASGVPGLLSYQGHVTDASGTPIGNGTPVNRTVFFKFYTESSGTADPIYAESQVVTISGGDFSVLIGNGSGIALLHGPSAPAVTPYVTLPSIFSGNLYLGITVDDGTAAADPEIAPRQQIVSSAYAFRAAVADSVADKALDTGMLNDGAVTADKIAAAQVTTSKLADYNPLVTDTGVTTAKLADFAITAAKIDPTTVGLWTPSGANVYRGGNVGIGQPNPGFPLNFADGTGDKLSLSGNSGAHYGFGIGAGLLQIHSGSSASDIAFGYGSSASFTEIMRVRGNGNVGLGTTTPSEKLQINGGSVLIQNTTSPALKLSTGSATADLGVAAAAGNFSSAAAIGDTVLRGSGTLRLLSGTGTSALTIDTSNRVGVATKLGVGRSDPGFPLTFADTLGDKISLWGNSGAHYGFGIASGLLQIHSDSSTSDIAFGYGSSGSFTQTMRVKGNGRVYMGASFGSQASAGGPTLSVGGMTATYYAYGHLNTNGSTESNGTESNISFAIETNGHILAPQFDVSSDARLKTIIHPSDSAADLDTLSRIAITDYRFKDSVANGSREHKKVIAQQVEQVFPAAVNQRPGVVPDLYQYASVNAGWVALATDLRPGDRVRLIEPNGDAVHAVLEVRPGAFRTDLAGSVTDVFVYGREVPDVRSVDYDAIAMLNVSATQELHRKVTALETALAQKDAQLSALETRLQALEQLTTRSR